MGEKFFPILKIKKKKWEITTVASNDSASAFSKHPLYFLLPRKIKKA